MLDDGIRWMTKKEILDFCIEWQAHMATLQGRVSDYYLHASQSIVRPENFARHVEQGKLRARRDLAPYDLYGWLVAGTGCTDMYLICRLTEMEHVQALEEDDPANLDWHLALGSGQQDDRPFLAGEEAELSGVLQETLLEFRLFRLQMGLEALLEGLPGEQMTVLAGPGKGRTTMVPCEVTAKPAPAEQAYGYRPFADLRSTLAAAGIEIKD